MAYSMVLLLNRINGNKKYVCAVILVFVLIFFGNNLYKQDFITRSTNPEKVPQDIIQLCNIIEADKNDNKAEVLTMAPSALTPYIRQIDTSIVLVYGRVWNPDDLTNTMDLIEGNRELIINTVNSTDCEYLIVYKSEAARRDYIMHGFLSIGDTDNCMVLKRI